MKLLTSGNVSIAILKELVINAFMDLEAMINFLDYLLVLPVTNMPLYVKSFDRGRVLGFAS